MANSCFYLRPEKDDNKVILEDKDLEVIGTASIQYDDTNVIMQHIESGLWVSYKVKYFYLKNALPRQLATFKWRHKMGWYNLDNIA